MNDKLSFEKALERLEQIVDELEGGNLSLEDALKRYEEGVKFSRTCQEKLAQAEKKIEVLTRSLDGTFKKEDFEPSETAANEGAPAARARKNKAKESRAGEDLLI